MPDSANSSTAQTPHNSQDVGTNPQAAGPNRLVSQPNPNARFANLTPAQRVEQARRHFPQSVDDLQK